MTGLSLQWQERDGLFQQVFHDGIPLVFRGGAGLLTARAWREDDPGKEIPLLLHHHLHESASEGDLLEAIVRVGNETAEACAVVIEFATSAAPSPALGPVRTHLPLTANGLVDHPALAELGKGQYVDCDLHLGAPGQNSGPLIAHYLEPAAVEAAERTTFAPLLIPLVFWYEPHSPVKLALFASPERAWRFARTGDARGRTAWTLRARLEIRPGSNAEEKCFLHVSGGGPQDSWGMFHRHAVAEGPSRIGWLDEARVHYFDFLSPGGPEARRGSGYDLSLPHFPAFRVGLATQHGYYSHWGDYLHPDRKEWLAMRGDAAGAAPMSLKLMRERIRATRAVGAKAGVYLHAAGFDSASPLDARLQDAARIQADGAPVPFPWEGPDMEGPARFMSISAPEWSAHLLQQAQWIFELLDPDAIVVDETFAGVGYDFHSSRPGPVSSSMIAFMKSLRALARSFGNDKAVLTSDCSLSAFVLWADGEGGDHAYPAMVGDERYRATPTRYRAALGTKPWLPCAWQFNRHWEDQIDLSRVAGAGVGLANGWIEYSGLHSLSSARRKKIMEDISAL